MRRVARALVGTLAMGALGGCLDRVLEGPYVLAVGLEGARSLTLAPDATALRVAGPEGVFDVSPDGAAERVGLEAVAITSDPRRSYALRGDTVTDAVANAPFATLGVAGRDVVAIEGGVVSLTDGRLAWASTSAASQAAHTHAVPRENGGALDFVVPSTAEPRDVPCALSGAQSLALGRMSDEVLVVAPDAIVAVRIAPDGASACEPLVAGLHGLRAAAVDAVGRVYVVADEDPALYRLDPAGPVQVARWLGDVRDAHFGAGVFPAENLYFIDGEGRVTYVRPPPPSHPSPASTAPG